MTGCIKVVRRAYVSWLLPSCCLLFSVGWSFALQVASPNSGSEVDSELTAGRKAIERQEFKDAMQHFAKANELQQGKCSECYVWLARMGMSAGKLQEALTEAEKGVATAATDGERSKAQLYRGVILGRQGDLPGAEAAFKAASQADAACVECRFNLGFVLLQESKDAEGVGVFKTIVAKFAGTPRGREIQRFIDDPSRIRKAYAPEFSAKTLSGQEINLDALKGKVVLLDFWGIWCAPCRVSLPSLKELAAKVDPTTVAIVSIDEGDPKDKWQEFVKSNGMTWLQVYDGDLSLHNAFRVDGFPRYYVLSKDGIILEQFKGWNLNGEATIADAIARALQERPPAGKDITQKF
jgi:thiol-disulfide isomerase/thioredoxin